MSEKLINVPDALYFEALELIRDHQVASSQFLQRRLKIGWNLAQAILQRMEKAGVVGPYAGPKLRTINTVRLRSELETE